MAVGILSKKVVEGSQDKNEFKIFKGPAGPILYFKNIQCKAWVGKRFNEEANYLCKQLNDANNLEQ